MSQSRRQDKKLIQGLFSGFWTSCCGLNFIPLAGAKKPAGKDEKPAGLLQLGAGDAKRYAIRVELQRTNLSPVIVTPAKGH